MIVSCPPGLRRRFGAARSLLESQQSANFRSMLQQGDSHSLYGMLCCSREEWERVVRVVPVASGVPDGRMAERT